MNIIEHIPAVRRWCQGGHKNKESHLEAHFSQPRLILLWNQSITSRARVSTLYCSSPIHVFSFILSLFFSGWCFEYIHISIKDRGVPSFIPQFYMCWCVTPSSLSHGSLIWFQGSISIAASHFSLFLFPSVSSSVSGSDSQTNEPLLILLWLRTRGFISVNNQSNPHIWSLMTFVISKTSKKICFHTSCVCMCVYSLSHSLCMCVCEIWEEVEKAQPSEIVIWYVPFEAVFL